MKQIVENSRTGAVSVQDVPAPRCPSNMVLVDTRASLISAGTEAQMIEFGKKSLIQKARSRPDLVKQVLRKIQTDGLMATYKTVQERLDVPTPLGYSAAGVVLEAGGAISHVRVGDRVACAGAGYASHAEAIVVPKNLVVKIPDNVDFDEASFATVGSIGLQGIRIADVKVGERVVVLGLGLIGLLTVQMLKANGAIVFGTDLNPARVQLAKDFGADEAVVLNDTTLEAVEAFTEGRGADCVLITAATDSSGPIETAGDMCRMKGRVVVIGQVGMNVPRRAYYNKELEIRMSMSYGPGRYDPNYEERGIDYPYAYVPFTEQRNLETFLWLVSQGKVQPKKLITHRFKVEDAERAYGIIKGDIKEPYLGLVFEYPELMTLERKRPNLAITGNSKPTANIGLGVIGAGQYARSMLLPKLKAMSNVRFIEVSTSRGISATDTAGKMGFEQASTDSGEVLRNNEINTVVIATRHDSHASLATAALEAGKHVFLEKPLATNEDDLRKVIAAAEASGKHLQVGFNRRFAPLIQQAMAKFKGHSQPLSMIYRVNAGAMEAGHWHHDPTEGGGRIIGEGCHFIDLMQYICGADPVSVVARSASGNTGAIPAEDIITITVTFADGSIGTLHYFANGDRVIQKEYLEVFGAGKTFILQDFRTAIYAEGGKKENWKVSGQDKGQQAELDLFVKAIVNGGETPIPLRQSVLTTLATFRAMDSMRSGEVLSVDWSDAQEAEQGGQA